MFRSGNVVTNIWTGVKVTVDTIVDSKIMLIKAENEAYPATALIKNYK